MISIRSILEIDKIHGFVSYTDLSILNEISESDAQKILPETTRQLMGELLRIKAGDDWRLVAPIDKVAGNKKGMKIYWNSDFSPDHLRNLLLERFQ